MTNKLLFLGGILAPLLYVGTVILGGLLRPGYSQAGQAVSELIEAGAPNKLLLDTLFTIYNLLLVALGLGLLGFVRSRDGVAAGAWGAWLLVVVGALGVLLTLFFPQDPRGTPATFPGTMHLVLAGVISLGTILTIVLTGLWFRNAPGWHGYGLYSFITAAFVFATGLLAAGSTAAGSPILGVFERLTIGGFLQWVFVIGLALFRA